MTERLMQVRTGGRKRMGWDEIIEDYTTEFNKYKNK